MVGRMTVVQGLYRDFKTAAFLMEQRVSYNQKLGHLPEIPDRVAFGAQMARCHPDRSVLILEKHSVPGGYASTFARRQSRFDCSLHKLSGLKNVLLGRMVAKTMDGEVENLANLKRVLEASP